MPAGPLGAAHKTPFARAILSLKDDLFAKTGSGQICRNAEKQVTSCVFRIRRCLILMTRSERCDARYDNATSYHIFCDDAILYYKCHHATKTGSGQTQGKVEKRESRFLIARVRRPAQRNQPGKKKRKQKKTQKSRPPHDKTFKILIRTTTR